MRIQVILDSLDPSFARRGSAPLRGGKKGEFRDWTMSEDEDASEYRTQKELTAEVVVLQSYFSLST